MHKLLILVLIVSVYSCTQKMPDDFILIKGGPFQNKYSAYYGQHLTVSDFFIDRYEVTQKDWIKVMGSNPSAFKGNKLPVETVSWYDCIVYCNKRSIKEGLKPYFNIDSVHKDAGNTNMLDTVKWKVTINMDANGYRLPTEAEWEFAASGGVVSRNHKYSGSDNIDDIAWYWKNAGDKYLTGAWSWPVLEKNHNRTKPVGSMRANELGIYDMSGNVREWCMNWNDDANAGSGPGKVWKGGGWMGSDFCCEPAFRASLEANGKGPDQGLRVCRSK